MTRPALHDAIHACVAALGADRVGLGSDALASANHGTFLTSNRVLAVLKPRNRDQVAQCLQIASRYRVPVYPVSTGRNWGYGSATPSQDGCMLLSLAGLHAILAFDAQTGRVRLEPGVSFEDLSIFLRARGARFQAPWTGSGARTSVIGNIMERGMGKGLYEDMLTHVQGCEALLPNGEVLVTRADACGPAPFGLLPQANLAVVVEITLQLEPLPALSQLLTWGIGGEATGLVQTLLPLHDRVVRSGTRTQLAFLNDYRVASQVGRFPHDRFDANTALPRSALQVWLEPWQGAQWIGACTLWADSEEELAWRRAQVCTTLAGLQLTPRVEPASQDTAPALDDDGLGCAYWRKPFPMPDNPDLDRDRCGVLWLAPQLPVNDAALADLVTVLESSTLAHGFEPAMALRTTRGGAVRLILGLFFDRDLPGADDRALLCHAALHDVLQHAQVGCYRHTVIDPIVAIDPGTRSLLLALKAHCDPHHILAPQRYGMP